MSADGVYAGLRPGADGSKLYGIYDGRIADLLPPLGAEIKEDQWLGVSLASQGIFFTKFVYGIAQRTMPHIQDV